MAASLALSPGARCLQRVKDWNPDQPRELSGSPVGGRWVGGGGEVEHVTGGGPTIEHAVPAGLGHGYSREAKLIGGVIHTSSVYDAARALYENRKVVLDQPREVATLIEHLGQVSKHMIAMGKDAPTFNLCNVSVEHTNLFCAQSKGVPRVKMPQLDDEQTKAFKEYLKAKGYAAEKTG
jgi:hypothetical protein